MSAEILRRAANAARDEWAGETTGPFKNAARIHLAVADLLDQIARDQELIDAKVIWTTSILWDAAKARALVVARAYLGSDA